MNTCIVGAGAIGGFLGTRLAAAGEGRVSALVRGDTLAALRTHGWRLRQDGALLSAPCTASEDAHELGAQDLVILALTEKGRVETTNYRTARVPTDLDVPEWVGRKFSRFYIALFDHQVAQDRMSAVYQEYAWPLSVKCDPCSATQPGAAQLTSLGASWTAGSRGGANGGFLTRLH
ncbi:MAG: 2-dehydropantoate 2-reductase N-terminal domain-containing protein, partial [Candidatus Eisenbacteria bacterium]